MHSMYASGQKCESVVVSFPSSLVGFLGFHPYMRLFPFRKRFCDFTISLWYQHKPCMVSVVNTTLVCDNRVCQGPQYYQHKPCMVTVVNTTLVCDNRVCQGPQYYQHKPCMVTVVNTTLVCDNRVCQGPQYSVNLVQSRYYMSCPHLGVILSIALIALQLGPCQVAT